MVDYCGWVGTFPQPHWRVNQESPANRKIAFKEVSEKALPKIKLIDQRAIKPSKSQRPGSPA